MLVAEFALFGRRRTWMLVLKGLSFTAILFALAEPTMMLPETKTGAVILVDTSTSVTRDDLSHGSSVINAIEQHRHGNWMKVVPFARETRSLSTEEMSGGLHLMNTSDDAGNGTDFEAALIDSMSLVPAGHIPRVVLMSDGKENEGSTPRAIAELERLRIPVDTIPLAGRAESSLRLTSISLPREAYSGEQIPIDLVIQSPHAAQASVAISAGDKNLGGNPIALESGTNDLHMHARVRSTGATSISGRISAENLGDLRFEQAVQLKHAKALYVSEDPPGTEANLLQALNQADFDLTRDVSLIDRGLGEIQLVVLNNIDLNYLSTARKSRLEEYVKNGGGLLLIGGERQLYKEDKQMDALDRALPGGSLRDALGLLGTYVVLANAVLAAFNVVPAYPMDGGRVLRALLWRRSHDREAATNTASRVGIVFALLFVAAGVLVVAATHEPVYGWYVLLGAFLLRQGVSQERTSRSHRAHAADVTVAPA